MDGSVDLQQPRIHRWSGVGLVVANMVGAGVLLSAGFMAQRMGPTAILLAWVFGLVVALLGARAYGAIAAVSGRSGGEYRYLSDYLHPSLGSLAGWGSLWMGFSAPIAVDAIAVGAFFATLVPGVDPRVTGSVVIAVLTLTHALHAPTSTWTQNALVVVKAALLLGFVAFGLGWGAHAWPTWTPPEAEAGLPVQVFFEQQYWIAFAFSGWNAAIYVAGEFKDPRRDVPRAMVAGTLAVGALYLVVNLIFVVNLTPELAKVVFSYEQTRITLAHTVMTHLVGEAGGRFTSVLTLLACVSAMSAMIFVGPRVYAQMAKDGFLPAALQASDGRPPLGSVLLQSALALAMVWTQSILDVVRGASLVMMVCTALTAACLFVIARRPDQPRVPKDALVAAGLFVAAQVVLVVIGAQQSRLLSIELAVFVAVGAVAYAATRRQRRLGDARA
ncbi:MAG: APC family permease [Deltaproteobacteria bacterium]|nr:APC family permease [Deltaproteobacteria bacterium]